MYSPGKCPSDDPPDAEDPTSAPSPPTETPRPPADQPPRATPVAFGRYQVARTLGSGGFGTVYLAHDVKLDRQVAIKVLNASHVSQFEVDQFLQEARRVARLRHPGIVAVHDVGVEAGQRIWRCSLDPTRARLRNLR